MESRFKPASIGRIALVLWLLLAPSAGYKLLAQVFPLQIQVNVMPPYSAYLQDYPGTGQQVRVFIINTSRSTYQVRLVGQLTGDNGIEIRTSPNYRPPRPVTIPPGQTLLSRTDLEGLFDLNQIEVTGIDKNLLARGLPLPDGTYQLCVRAYNETATNTAAVAFGQSLSAEFPLGCSASIVVKSVEPPILISPLCDADVIATTPQSIVFTWTPPAGVSPAQVDYTLRIVELPQENVDPNVFIDAIALPKSGVEVRNLRTSTFLYGPTQPPLLVGKRYAWRVQAIDRSRKLNFQNDGKSPVCAFTYGVDGVIQGDKKPVAYVYKSNKIEATCSCKQTPADQTANNKPALQAGKATVAGFPITFLKTADGVKETADGVLTGSGTIPMPIVNNPYFKLRVELVDVQCNAAGQVISGYVQAIRSGDFPGIFPKASKPSVDPPGIPVISTANADSVGSQVQKLSDQLKAFPGHLLSQAGEVAKSVGMEVPFGIDKSFGPISTNIAITDVIFTPEDAYFNATTFIESPGLSAQFNGIPLAAYHVCIQPDGTCGDKILYLAKDMAASSLLTLKGGFASLKALQNNYTHVTFDEKGFKSLHVVAGINTPGLLRKSDNQPLELRTTFDLPTPDFKNWTAQVQTEDDFYVTGMDDFVLSMKDANGKVQPAIYDHDDDKNPGVMPASYDPGKDPTWHGLYLPNLSISLPFLKSLNNGNDVPIGVQGMIYDANGFTGQAFAGTEQKPLIAMGDGSMGGWYCSTEQLSLTFVQSSFVGGGLNGQVVLPIFKYTAGDNSGKSSVWPWTCTYTKANKSFQFVVSPKNDAYVDLWKAQLSIQKEGQNLKMLQNGQPNTTAITATYDEKGFNAKAVLNMTLSLNTGVLVAPNMRVEGLAFQTNPPAGEDFFSPGSFTAGLNSPQRYIGGEDEDSGLPLELQDVGIKKAASQKQGEYDINLTGGINLTKISSVKAVATGYVRFKVGNNAKGRPDWGYVTTGLTSASVNGALGPIGLAGELKLFGFDGAEDQTYGKGVSAALTVSVLGANFGGSTLEGYFGSKKDAQGRFRYWQVGGYADLGAPGIPIAPAINFRKFGGGAFNNMKLTLDTTAKGEPTGKISFVPARGGCGFQAAVGVTTADGTAVGLTGRLTVGFTSCDGDLNLNNVALDANAQLLVGSSPLAEGRGVFNIAFENNKPTVIDGAATLNAGFSAGSFFASGSGQMGLHVDLANSSNFYFYLGRPISDNSRITIKMGVKGVFEEEFSSYFFMGNAALAGITKLPPDPYKVDPALLKQLNYVGGKAVPSNALAFGSGLHFHYDDSFGPFYIDFTANAGFDLVLKNGLYCAGDPNAKPGTPASKSYEPGINGWYANGQVYASLDLALGIDVDLWFYSGRLEALRVTAAALLEGGMVNPIWLHGSALLKYRVLGGRIKGSVQAEFWYQKDYRCVVAMQQPNPFASMPIISMVLPTSSDKEPISTITPLYAEFNYPVRALIEVNDVDQQGNPIDKFRTFRLDFMAGKQFKLTPFASKAPADAKCAGIETGRLVIGQAEGDDEGSYNATFYRDAAMQPFTSYSLTVGIQVYIKSSNCTTSPVANCQNIGPVWADYMFASKGKDGKLGAPQPVNETQTVTFTTGDCNGTLTRDGTNATVSYSFPFEGQRYFTVDDAANGFVELNAILCCGDKIKSDANFDLNVRMVPFNGHFDESKALMATKVQFDDSKDNRITYQLPPNLQTQSLYRLDVVRIPNANFVKAQEAELAKQKATYTASLMAGVTGMGTQPGKTVFTYNPNFSNSTSGQSGSTSGNAVVMASANPGAGLGSIATGINKTASAYVNSYIDGQQFSGSNGINTTLVTSIQSSTVTSAGPVIKVTPEQQTAAIKKKFEQVLYSYPFQTSRYKTLSEKLADTKIMNEQVQVNTSIILGTLPDGVFSVPVQAKEGFDTYELEWETLGKGKVTRPPLVLLKANTAGNGWFDSFVKPTVDLINAMSQTTKASGAHVYGTSGVAGKTNLNPVNYDGLMRSLMSFNRVFDTPQPPISAAEIKAISTTSGQP